MTVDKDAPLETVWQGKYISALKRGRWEYVSRTGSTDAVVILAEHEGKVILIEQYRVPVGGICLELPAGLVGDEDEHATVEDTAVKELEEETGFTCDRVERLGEFQARPEWSRKASRWSARMASARLARAAAITRRTSTCFLVAREDIPDFIAQRRAAGSAIDVKLLLFANY